MSEKLKSVLVICGGTGNNWACILSPRSDIEIVGLVDINSLACGRLMVTVGYFMMWHNESWTWHPDTHPDRVWDDVFSRYNTGRPMYSPNGNGGVPNCNATDAGSNPKGCAYSRNVRENVIGTPWAIEMTTRSTMRRRWCVSGGNHGCDCHRSGARAATYVS